MTNKICRYNKYGFCQYGDKCHFRHVNVICESKTCSVFDCEKRHPVICKFYANFKMCKFSPCAYKHETEVNELDKKIENVVKKTINVDKLEKKVNEFENKLKEIRVDAFEEQLHKIIKANKEKDKKIAILENKVKDFENIHQVVKTLEKKIDDLEGDMKKKVKKNETLTDKLDKLQNTVKSLDIKIVKCSQCDFTSHSDQGLKTHIKRKHSAAISENQEKCSKSCDLCGKEFKNEKEMKKHLKSHSFKQIEYKCEECDFLGTNTFTMEVHLGKSHSDQYECGLCDFVAKSFESLETHLFTCEIYKCDECEKRFQKICDMKAHIEIDHEASTYFAIMHAKQSRYDSEEIDVTEYAKHFFVKNI